MRDANARAFLAGPWTSCYLRISLGLARALPDGVLQRWRDRAKIRAECLFLGGRQIPQAVADFAVPDARKLLHPCPQRRDNTKSQLYIGRKRDTLLVQLGDAALDREQPLERGRKVLIDIRENFCQLAHELARFLCLLPIRRALLRFLRETAPIAGLR